MIELADKWTRQPQRPTGVSADWKARGLVALFDTRRQLELVHNNPASSSGTSSRPSLLGVTADFATTASQRYSHRPTYATTGALTIIAFGDVAALTDYTAIIAKQATTTTYGAYELRMGASGPTAGDPFFVRADATSFGYVYTYGLALAPGVSQVVSLRTAVGSSNDTAAVFGVGRSFATLASAGGGPVAPADNGSDVIIGGRSDGVTHLNGRLYYVALFNRALTDGEVLSIVANPWQLYAKRPKRLFLSVGGGGGVTGTAAVTLGNDTSSATGTTTVKGTAAPTLGNATSSATGVVGSVSGTAAITLGNDTSSAQGTTSIGGTGAVTLGNDTCSASGAVGSAIIGTAAITLGNDASSAQGTTKILGSAAITLGSDFSTTQGTTKILGSAAITLGNDFATAFGTSGTPTVVSSPRGLTIRIGLAL